LFAATSFVGICRGESTTSTRQITTSVQLKTAVSTSSRLFSLSDSVQKPSTSGTLQTLVASQQIATRRPTQRIVLTQESHSVAPAQPARPAIYTSPRAVSQFNSVLSQTVVPSQQTTGPRHPSQSTTPIRGRHSDTRPALPVSDTTTTPQIRVPLSPIRNPFRFPPFHQRLVIHPWASRLYSTMQ
jgi:hypothetical protein